MRIFVHFFLPCSVKVLVRAAASYCCMSFVVNVCDIDLNSCVCSVPVGSLPSNGGTCWAELEFCWAKSHSVYKD